MSAIQEYLDHVTSEEKEQIIEGFEEFMKLGVVGDVPLRLHTNAFMAQHDIDSHVTLWMTEMAFGCYRYFALKYLESDARHD